MGLITCFIHSFLMLAAIILLGPTFSDAQTITPTTNPTPLTIDETDSPIRVDGHLDDWPAARMIVLNKMNQVTYGKAYWKGAEYFSGRIFITYDSRYLYIAAVVQKKTSVVCPPEKLSLWNGDCVELFLSTNPMAANHSRLTLGDYHLGFSPGTSCGNPQIYCFNKNEDVGGSRIIARATKNGYLMESCVPLTFFKGLELGSGKLASLNVILDEGGSVGGNRMVELDYSNDLNSWEKPSTWTQIQWIGKTTTVSVPFNQLTDLYASHVLDGTKDSTFLGSKTISGLVTDAQGSPLAGAKVTTWPRSREIITDKSGIFQFDRIKYYDSTFFCARMDGFASSLSVLSPKAKGVTITLQIIPKYFESEMQMMSPLFCGGDIKVNRPDGSGSLFSQIQDWLNPMGFGALKMTGTESLTEPLGMIYSMIDQFVGYCRDQKVEPVIEVPIFREDPDMAAQWVAYCNATKNYNIRYWTIGNEPDLAALSKDSVWQEYNAYDYINDFRAMYNSMKQVDPSIFILGPELAVDYTEGEEDWLTPFIQYDGDIVNMASVHHRAITELGPCNFTMMSPSGTKSKPEAVTNLYGFTPQTLEKDLQQNHVAEKLERQGFRKF